MREFGLILIGFVLGMSIPYLFHLVAMVLRHCGSLT